MASARRWSDVRPAVWQFISTSAMRSPAPALAKSHKPFNMVLSMSLAWLNSVLDRAPVVLDDQRLQSAGALGSGRQRDVRGFEVGLQVARTHAQFEPIAR